MFIKLNQKFNDISYLKGDVALSYEGIISYFYIDELKADLLQIVPSKYKDAFSVSEMKITGAVPPHTDSNVKTVINFYVKPSNYRTVFFSGESPSYQVLNQTNGRVFYRENLTELDSFVATEGDAFCLNVEQPHAVDALDATPTERIAICLSTNDYDFEQVCNMLCDTRYIH